MSAAEDIATIEQCDRECQTIDFGEFSKAESRRLDDIDARADEAWERLIETARRDPRA